MSNGDIQINNIVIDAYPFKYYWRADGKRGWREPNYRPVKLALIEKYGVCYFCGIKVKDQNRQYRESFWPDAATIDHLTPRPNNKNPVGRKKYEVSEKVLACYQCNSDRNIKYHRTRA